MRVNVFTYSSYGGAGKVALALVEGFNQIGLNAKLNIATKSNLRSNPLRHPQLTAAAITDNHVLKKNGWQSLISLKRDFQSVLGVIDEDADLNVFRWMNGTLGKVFSTEGALFPNLVWGLDDMNPFTGVCHYSGTCRGFESNCSKCPALKDFVSGEARQNLDRKMRFADLHGARYVAPTDWIHEEFRKSKLSAGHDSYKIMNPLQSSFFNTEQLRKEDSSKLRILIVAHSLDDETKGIWGSKTVITELMNLKHTQMTLIGSASTKLRRQLPHANFLGPLETPAVISQMKLHDVLLVPSIHENAGTVVAEAASQGLPSVVRNVGGLPEMTQYGQSGLVFEDDGDLRAIFESLRKPQLISLGALAKDWSRELTPSVIATRYAEIYGS